MLRLVTCRVGLSCDGVWLLMGCLHTDNNRMVGSPVCLLRLVAFNNRLRSGNWSLFACRSGFHG